MSNVRAMRIFLLKRAFAILAVVLGLVVIYFWLTPFALTEIQFSSSACDEPLNMDTIVQSNWKGRMYHVTIDQIENCAEALQSTAVQRIANHIFVRTKFNSPSGLSTACYCQHTTNLIIPNLPYSEFQVHAYSWP